MATTRERAWCEAEATATLREMATDLGLRWVAHAVDALVDGEIRRLLDVVRRLREETPGADAVSEEAFDVVVH